MTATPNTLRVTVSFTLDIDTDEWTRQFPDDDNVPALIAQSAAEHAALVVSDLYRDQGWTRGPISDETLSKCRASAVLSVIRKASDR